VRVEYEVVLVVMAVYVVVYVVGAVFVVDVEEAIVAHTPYSSCSLGIDLDCLPKQPRD
jgi:hypothetical protein